MAAADPDVDDDVRPAATLYDTVERAGRRVTWLALLPLTGRTHQLRVHCALIGTPIVGDGKYGGAEAHVDGLAPKLHLHARAIALPHPDGGLLRVAAPLTAPMRESWALFGFDPEQETDRFPAEP
jgi:23S rRNA pseudouridine955/2504/2580 synthase